MTRGGCYVLVAFYIGAAAGTAAMVWATDFGRHAPFRHDREYYATHDSARYQMLRSCANDLRVDKNECGNAMAGDALAYSRALHGRVTP